MSKEAIKLALEMVQNKMYAHAEMYLAEALAKQEQGEPVALAEYDAGSLNDYGGGNVGWWWDYIRYELGRAHDHYQEQVADLYTTPQPKQEQGEPVAWIYKSEPSFDGNKWHDTFEVTTSKQVALWKDKTAKPLYTTPPQRTWVGLTDEQKHQLNQSLNLQGRFPVIDAIEAICKGNNT